MTPLDIRLSRLHNLTTSMDTLARIKSCALLRNVRFTLKATDERVLDNLTELEILESLVNATQIEKRIRSTRKVPGRRRPRPEYLYIINAPTLRGEWVYTKGKFVDEHGAEVYYLLISSKLAE